jgi:hypothetical protein
MFDVAFAVKGNARSFEKLNREEFAEWVAKQLRDCGFDTRPSGCSWGVLKNE